MPSNHGSILPMHRDANNGTSLSPDRVSDSSHSTFRHEFKKRDVDMVGETREHRKMELMVVWIELLNTAVLIVIAVAAGYISWFLAKAGKNV